MSIVDDTSSALHSWLFSAITDITEEEQEEMGNLLEDYVLARIAEVIAEALEEHIRNG